LNATTENRDFFVEEHLQATELCRYEFLIN
jgi:hypothetical protein